MEVNRVLYKIARITDRTGADITSGRYPKRVGREGHILHVLQVGEPLYFGYIEPDCGTLITSVVVTARPTGHGITVETANSVYHLTQVEAGRPEWPEPIDREVES